MNCSAYFSSQRDIYNKDKESWIQKAVSSNQKDERCKIEFKYRHVPDLFDFNFIRQGR